jgi:8-oxo-dGTP diphosphatase
VEKETMITCVFEDGGKGALRHVTTDAILELKDQILLVKRSPNLLEGGKWALPGGHLVRDENMHEGVRREIQEESGYSVSNLMLFMINSDPNRPREDRQNINLTFIAVPDIKTTNPDNEVSEAKWFQISSLPGEEEIAFDHHMVLSRYRQYREKQFNLPILI